ncbi:MAG TPA: hypothetical protein VJL58_01540 [Pyrinomonadaceae bacterium]|nr:hypothetical protein [Pyrinomonadaceae bacterium]
MKLRIKGNSIRFRLLRSEVERLAAIGKISDTVHFGARSLTYTLIASSSVESIHSRFENAEIVIEIPVGEARGWAESETISITGEQSVDDGTLSMLIEKDFACLERPDDPDRDDAFPNPSLACKAGQ